MAREARKISSLGLYSVRLCGDRLFKSEEDKNVFLDMLKKYFADGEIYGYDLSDAEIRLVVKEAPKGISMTMKPLTTSYARYFNRTHNTEGKLFLGRFKSEPIESEEERQEAVKALSNSSKGTQKTKTAAKKRDTKAESEEKTNPKPQKEEVKRIVRRNDMPSYLL